MDLMQLRYFRALAKNGNLTQTARLLYIAPPALSVSISRLEKELGVQLFDRTGRRMYLNSCGKAFLEKVDTILGSLDYAVDEVRGMNKKNDHTIYIASTSPNVFQMCFLAFMHSFPHYNLSHTWVRSDQLRSHDLMQKYNFLIASPGDFLPEPELDSCTLYDKDYVVLLCPADHPLSKRKVIDLAEVKDFPFVALSPDYSSRKLFDKVFEKAKITPNIVMVEQGAGLSIATAHTKIIGHCGTCCAIKIDPPYTPRSQIIYWNKAMYQSEASKDFLEFICNYYENFSFELN